MTFSVLSVSLMHAIMPVQKDHKSILAGLPPSAHVVVRPEQSQHNWPDMFIDLTLHLQWNYTRLEIISPLPSDLSTLEHLFLEAFSPVCPQPPSLVGPPDFVNLGAPLRPARPLLFSGVRLLDARLLGCLVRQDAQQLTNMCDRTSAGDLRRVSR